MDNAPLPVSNIPSTMASAVTDHPINTQHVVYAGFFHRFVAAIIDGVIIGTITSALSFAVNFITGMALGVQNGTVPGASQDIAFATANIVNMFVGLINLGINIGYFVYFIGKTGQTPGKSLMHLKVIRLSDGLPPGYGSAILREAIGKFISAIAIFLGYLWMIWDPRKQTWHDKIAGTVVIKTQ
jgi:uncharacterized RDD family membrane protein YckC